MQGHRVWLQIMGFGWVFALFLICGAAFPQLISSPGRLRVFQVTCSRMLL